MPIKKIIEYKSIQSFISAPVFVVGCGRSGTTALVKSLSQHPQVHFGLSEAAIIEHIGNVAYHYECSDIADYYHNTTHIHSDSLKNTLRTICFESVFGEKYGLEVILRQFMGRIKKLLPLRYWGAKAFPPEDQAKGLVWLFPEVKFLYIYRNGLDVVHSMTRTDFAERMNFEALCRFWADRILQYKYLTNWDKAQSVRFNDFLGKPQEVLQEIMQFLELDYHPAPYDFATTTMVGPLGKSDKKTDPKEEMRKRAPGYASWTHDQKSIFKNVCQGAMEESGYEIPF
tara:strand:- start:3 stop:857 length:855 start_codon:yes stop_codon:yes gene_type:complete